MLSKGSFINDRYEIVSRVGAGGMSDVYKAIDHKLNRNVAIKVLKKEFSKDKTKMGMCIRFPRKGPLHFSSCFMPLII